MGVEISAHAAACARDLLGLEVYPGDVSAVEIDAIRLGDVVDLRALLEAIGGDLAAGAVEALGLEEGVDDVASPDVVRGEGARVGADGAVLRGGSSRSGIRSGR